jgi:hypothetical protein
VIRTAIQELSSIAGARAGPGTEIFYVMPRYRRPPIAERRIISMTDEHVEYWANDLGLKAWVKIKLSVEEFLELLIQHVPEKNAHGIRYFGLGFTCRKAPFFKRDICPSGRGAEATP